jgi:hypothetical protein
MPKPVELPMTSKKGAVSISLLLLVGFTPVSLKVGLALPALPSFQAAALSLAISSEASDSAAAATFSFQMGDSKHARDR